MSGGAAAERIGGRMRRSLVGGAVMSSRARASAGRGKKMSWGKGCDAAAGKKGSGRGRAAFDVSAVGPEGGASLTQT